jgi:hypothetical protein
MYLTGAVIVAVVVTAAVLLPVERWDSDLKIVDDRSFHYCLAYPVLHGNFLERIHKDVGPLTATPKDAYAYRH